MQAANQDAETFIYIGGHFIPAMVSPKLSHFPEVNIIAMDYIAPHNVKVVLDSTKSMFKILLWIGGQDGSLVRLVEMPLTCMVSVLIFLGKKWSWKRSKRATFRAV